MLPIVILLTCFLIAFCKDIHTNSTNVRIIGGIHFGTKSFLENGGALRSFLENSITHAKPYNFGTLVINGNLFDFWQHPLHVEPPDPRSVLYGEGDADQLSAAALKAALIDLSENKEIVVILGYAEMGVKPRVYEDWLGVKSHPNIKIAGSHKIRNGVLVHSGADYNLFTGEDPLGRRPFAYYMARVMASKGTRASSLMLPISAVTANFLAEATLSVPLGSLQLALHSEMMRQLLSKLLACANGGPPLNETTVVVQGHWQTQISNEGRYVTKGVGDVKIGDVLDQYSNLMNIWRTHYGADYTERVLQSTAYRSWEWLLEELPDIDALVLAGPEQSGFEICCNSQAIVNLGSWIDQFGTKDVVDLTFVPKQMEEIVEEITEDREERHEPVVPIKNAKPSSLYVLGMVVASDPTSPFKVVSNDTKANLPWDTIPADWLGVSVRRHHFGKSQMDSREEVLWVAGEAGYYRWTELTIIIPLVLSGMLALIFLVSVVVRKLDLDPKCRAQQARSEEVDAIDASLLSPIHAMAASSSSIAHPHEGTRHHDHTVPKKKELKVSESWKSHNYTRVTTSEV
eukprot:Platyproteum_vivax@DN6497_c1_g1_i1.p1